MCEDAPWEDEPSGDTTTISKFTEKRVKNPTRRSTSPTGERVAQNRRVLWSMLQLALADAVPDEKLFQSSVGELFWQLSGSRRSFILRPPTHSPVPLQRLHVGARTIPDSLADIPCAQISSAHLLTKLNSIMCTNHTLHTPDLQHLLKHVLNKAHDFGEAYGILRPWWSPSLDPSGVLRDMERLRLKVSELRNGAIREPTSSTKRARIPSWIENSHIPPRRVWDLCSNRVLPFYTLPDARRVEPESLLSSIPSLPANLWTVSHSWVAEKDRVEVWTNINRKRWPVPIPRGTSLEHVRIELLNMGAEYVWLDVLCLRQRGLDADEETRQEEWKLDVSTIGYIYQGWPNSRPCVVYFNGLGLPLDTSPELLESDRHWFNRAWTLQETLESWLPGGLTGEPLASGRDFFLRLRMLVRSMGSTEKRAEFIQDLTRRHCTKELDKVSGLAYYLGCRTLPVYDESLSVESAWALLIRHMSETERIRMFLEYATDSPFGPCISWSDFLQPISSLPSIRSVDLEELEPWKIKITDEGALTCLGDIIGPCKIHREPLQDVIDGIGSSHDIMVRLHVGRDSACFRPSGIHGVFLADISYFLVRLSTRSGAYWVAVEVVERGDWGLHSRVIKWGVIGDDQNDLSVMLRLHTAERKSKTVTYLDGKEARKRSAHAERYMEAFTEMRARGEVVTFGA